jgi:predicted ATP-dependent Lon-type protease
VQDIRYAKTENFIGIPIDGYIPGWEIPKMRPEFCQWLNRLAILI